jgi:tRNA A37 threonylcarbamoyladenosine modification protein TsaB
LGEKKQNNFVFFDSSTSRIIFGGCVDGVSFFDMPSLEKSKLSRELPALFQKYAERLDFSAVSRIFAGIGPGSFTGIKTGAAFFLGFIYSLGFRNVEVMSSFALAAALAPESVRPKLVIIPFNKGEFFAALYDPELKPMVLDIFLKPPYDEIENKFKNFSGLEVDLVSPVVCGEEILPDLKKIFRISSCVFDGFALRPGFFSGLPPQKVLDITTEPFLVNHVVAPANLDNSANFYLDKMEADMTQELSKEAILEKLAQLREEHAQLDKLSTELSSKPVFTPQDEIELNMTRKKKLQKKDMIAYYEAMLKK